MKEVKPKKKYVLRIFVIILVMAIIVTSVATYMASGASIAASNKIIDADSAAESYLAENTDYVQQSRINRAKTVLKNTLTAFKQDLNSHYDAMSIAIAKQKYEDALAECNVCLNMLKDDSDMYVDLLMKRGCLEALLGRYIEATDTFKEIVKRDDNIAQPHLLLAELFLEQGEVENATEHLVRYSELNPDDTSQLGVICELYYGQNNYSKSIEYGQKSLESNQNNDADVYNAIALSELLTGNYDQAIEYLNESLELMKIDAVDAAGEKVYAIASEGETFYYRGLCRLTKEQYEDAVNDFDSAIELGYQTTLTYYNRGVCKLQLQDYDGCYDDFTVVVKNNDADELTDIASEVIKAIDDAYTPQALPK